MSYQLIRSFYILLGIFAICVYIFLCFIGGVNWQQELGLQETFWLKMNFVLNWLIFIPGLSLVLLAQYLLIYIKDTALNSIGIVILIIFVLAHFWIEVGAAHASPKNSLVLHLLEIVIHTITFLVIAFVVKKKFATPTHKSYP